MATNASQGIYSPLPQSLSDSDSEKETPVTKQQNGMKKTDNVPLFRMGMAVPNHKIEKPRQKCGFAAMSPMRRLCFATSIAICLATVVIFLWAFPCDRGTCPVKISNWDQTYDRIEFKGKINIVKGVHGLNLALLYRGRVNTTDKNGAISVLGNNGIIAFYIPQTNVPSRMECDLIDVNGDGVSDCLILGEVGIEAVDPISGKIFWHVHTDYESKAIANVEFPVIIPDLNGDGAKELITKLKGSGNKFLIVNGRNGIVLYDMVAEECKEVQAIDFEQNGFIYFCNNGTKKSYFHVTLGDLKARVSERNLAFVPTSYNYHEVEQTFVQTGHRLNIVNSGTCPDCRTTISLFNEKTRKQLWTYTHEDTYAMKPTSFRFRAEKQNQYCLDGYLNGFIIKLWQFSKTQRGKNLDLTARLSKRNIPASNVTKANLIYERVVLVTFNQTDCHVTNSSSTEITQLCFSSPNESVVCQPDLANQNESLLIRDLDGDGMKELITYSSTYSLGENFQLASTIKVICLEAELPKLYEAK